MVVGSVEGSAKVIQREHLLESIGEQLVGVHVREPSVMSLRFHMSAAQTEQKRIFFVVVRKRSCKRNAGEKIVLQGGGGRSAAQNCEVSVLFFLFLSDRTELAGLNMMKHQTKASLSRRALR